MVSTGISSDEKYGLVITERNECHFMQFNDATKSKWQQTKYREAMDSEKNNSVVFFFARGFSVDIGVESAILSFKSYLCSIRGVKELEDEKYRLAFLFLWAGLMIRCFLRGMIRSMQLYRVDWWLILGVLLIFKHVVG